MLTSLSVQTKPVKRRNISWPDQIFGLASPLGVNEITGLFNGPKYMPRLWGSCFCCVSGLLHYQRCCQGSLNVKLPALWKSLVNNNHIDCLQWYPTELLSQNRKRLKSQSSRNLSSLSPRMSHHACSLCRSWPVNCIFWPIETLDWLVCHYSGHSIA